MTALEKPPSPTRHFYQSNRLCSLIGSRAERLVMAQAVAIGQQSSNRKVQLFHLDSAESVIGSSAAPSAYQYPPFGGGRIGTALLMAAFVGQHFDETSGGYPLGNGRRFYKPEVFRFTSPDMLSPFDKGGANPYSYCLGDPINRHDPSGQFPIFRYLLRAVARTTVTASRHFNRATEALIRMVDEVVADTLRDAGRQLTPIFEAGREVITAAAAAVPTELSMRVNTLHLTLEPPTPRAPRADTQSPNQLGEQRTHIRRR